MMLVTACAYDQMYATVSALALVDGRRALLDVATAW